MAAHVGDPQRRRVTDQFAEHATTRRQRPDHPPHRLVDAQGQESPQMRSRLIQHPQRGIPCARYITRRHERPLKDHLDVQILQHTPGDIQHPSRDALLASSRRGDRRFCHLPRLVRKSFVSHVLRDPTRTRYT